MKKLEYSPEICLRDFGQWEIKKLLDFQPSKPTENPVRQNTHSNVKDKVPQSPTLFELIHDKIFEIG